MRIYPDKKNRPQLPALLGDTSKGVPLLYEGGDIFEISDSFFEDAAAYDEIREDIESGKIIFHSEDQKERYLEYLDSQSAKNETIYRRQFSEYIKTARIPVYKKEQLQFLSEELSVDQLQVLTDELNQKGVRSVLNNRNWEQLMRVLLSDGETAAKLAADEAYSPICPRIWEGMDIVEEEGMQVTGYYYNNKQYYIDIYCPGSDPVSIALGKSLPSNVSLRITTATAWDMVGESLELLLKMYLSLPLAADFTYAYCVENGMTRFLPEGISPSDVPYLGDLLSQLDPLDHTMHIQKETIFVSVVVEQGGGDNPIYNKMEVQTRFRERR